MEIGEEEKVQYLFHTNDAFKPFQSELLQNLLLLPVFQQCNTCKIKLIAEVLTIHSFQKFWS